MGLQKVVGFRTLLIGGAMIVSNAIADDNTKKDFLSERINYVLSLVSESKVFDHIENDNLFDSIVIEPVKEGDEIKGALVYKGSKLAILERKGNYSPWNKSSLIVKNYGFHDEDNFFVKSFFDNLKLQFIRREKNSFKFDVSQYSNNLSKDFCRYYFIWEKDPLVHFSLTSDVVFCEQQELYPIKIRTITIEKYGL